MYTLPVARKLMMSHDKTVDAADEQAENEMSVSP